MPWSRFHFSQILRRRRRVAVELDRLLGTHRYPDPRVLHQVPPSREASQVDR